MTTDDPIKDILEKDLDNTKSISQTDQQRVQSIVRKIKAKQGQKDVLEFGLIKMWSILLQFLAQLHLSTQKKTMTKHKTFKTNHGDLK